MEQKNIFTPLAPEEREAVVTSYLEHLCRRDGAPDYTTRRFSVREDFFHKLESQPAIRDGPPAVDNAVFKHNEARRYPQSGLDEATLWALAMAKSNRAERDAVEYTLSCEDTSSFDLKDPLTYILIEEFYHTRILEDVLNIIGLEMQLLPPPPVSRYMGRAITHLPKPISNVIIFSAEIAGVGVFRLLRDKANELFNDQPEPLNRIESLFQQILVDEVGHVHYARSQLSPAQVWIARKLLPFIAHGFLSDIPEYKILFGEKLMETILTADVDGAVAQYEDKFVPRYQ